MKESETPLPARGPGKGADQGAWSQARTALEAGAGVDVFLELAAPGKAARRGVAQALSGPGAETIRAELAHRAGSGAQANDPVLTLLRKAAGKQDAARKRRNPIRLNEAFLCTHCSFDVPPAPGGGIRNHCPHCLRSLHVDGAVPGDRASDCGGIMDPENPLVSGGEVRVTHRCRTCGAARASRLHPDWEIEPDQVDSLWGKN